MDEPLRHGSEPEVEPIQLADATEFQPKIDVKKPKVSRTAIIIGSFATAAVLGVGIFIGSHFGGGEVGAGPNAQEPVATAPVVPGTTETPTTSPAVANSPEVTTPKNTIEKIDSLILDNSEPQAKNFYADIDWETLEGIARTAPPPIEIKTRADEEVNAQAIVDAFFYNRNMAFLLADPSYQEAFVSNYPENNYNGSIQEWQTNQVKYYFEDLADLGGYWNQEIWGKALDITKNAEDNSYTISGEQVFYLQNVLSTNLEIADFKLVVTTQEQDDGSLKWVELDMERAEPPILDRDNQAGDTAFTIWNEGNIVLPYQQK